MRISVLLFMVWWKCASKKSSLNFEVVPPVNHMSHDVITPFFAPFLFLSLHFWNATFPLLPSLIDGACVIANDVIARVRPSASCHDCQTVREQTASSSLHAVGTEIRIGLWDAAALQLLLPPPLYMYSCCKNCDIMTTFTEKALSLLRIPSPGWKSVHSFFVV